MHVRGLRSEQDEVMSQVAKYLLGPTRYRKALGIQGSVVAQPTKEGDEDEQDDRLLESARLRGRRTAKAACEPGHTAARDHCTPASGEGGGAGSSSSDKGAAGFQADDALRKDTYRESNAAIEKSAYTLKNFSPQQLKVLKEYTGGAFDDMNAELRSGAPSDKAKSLEDAIAAAPPLKEPLTVYRGVKTKGSEAAQKFLDRLQQALDTGGEVELEGFGSTSLNADKATQFAGLPEKGFMMEILAKHGVAVTDEYADVGGESEFITNHKSRFRVVAIKEIPYEKQSGAVVMRRTVQLEQVS